MMIALSVVFHVGLMVKLTHDVVVYGEMSGLMVGLTDNLVSIIVHRLTRERGVELHATFIRCVYVWFNGGIVLGVEHVVLFCHRGAGTVGVRGGGVVGVVGVRRGTTENVEHDEERALRDGRGGVGVLRGQVGLVLARVLASGPLRFSGGRCRRRIVE